MLPARITVEDPGEGNLDARVYAAAVVGPYRVAHGQVRPIMLQTDIPQRVIANPKSVTFVSISLPADVPGPLTFIVSRQQDGGRQGVPVVLANSQGVFNGQSYQAVLRPSDELWIQTAPGGNNVTLVTSQVWF